MKLKFLVTSIILLVVTTVFSQNKKTDPTRWTPEDIINTESMGSVSFSPNNTMVVWTKRKGVKAKDRFVTDIYLTRLDIKKDGKFRTFHPE